MNNNNGSGTGEKVKVLIVDDHPLIRNGLRQLINMQDDLECCGDASTQAATHELVVAQKPALVTVDIRLRDGDGLQLIRTLRAQHPAILTLVISQCDEAIYAERALKAGARGYVMKERSTEDMLAAIRTVLRGGYYVSPQVAVIALNKMSGLPAQSKHPIHKLTDRELQILQLLGAGLGNRKVAERLFLSVKTIEAHRENIKHKLGIACATELVSFAIEWVNGQSSQW